MTRTMTLRGTVGPLLGLLAALLTGAPAEGLHPQDVASYYRITDG
jgi:hypothetical protein